MTAAVEIWHDDCCILTIEDDKAPDHLPFTPEQAAAVQQMAVELANFVDVRLSGTIPDEDWRDIVTLANQAVNGSPEDREGCRVTMMEILANRPVRLIKLVDREPPF
jgi:hypothetical protein